MSGASSSSAAQPAGASEQRQVVQHQMEQMSLVDMPAARTLRHLDFGSLRSLLACGKSTARESTWMSTLPGTMRRLIIAQHLEFQAMVVCPSPRGEWTESWPLCSSPFCNKETGLWLPWRKSNEEVGSDQDGPEEFSSGWSVYGSITIRSVIANAKQASFVACCHDCGKLLKQIIRIRRSHENVLLASHWRVAPLDEYRQQPQPDEYRLLSEIVNSSGSSTWSFVVQGHSSDHHPTWSTLLLFLGTTEWRSWPP